MSDKILLVPSAHYVLGEKPSQGVRIVAAKSPDAALLLIRPKGAAKPFRAIVGVLDCFDHHVDQAAGDVIRAFGDTLEGVVGCVYVKEAMDYFFLKPIRKALEQSGLSKDRIAAEKYSKHDPQFIGVNLQTGKVLCDKGFDALCCSERNLVDYNEEVQRWHRYHREGQRLYPKKEALEREFSKMISLAMDMKLGEEDYKRHWIAKAVDLTDKNHCGVAKFSEIITPRGKRLVFAPSI